MHLVLKHTTYPNSVSQCNPNLLPHLHHTYLILRRTNEKFRLALNFVFVIHPTSRWWHCLAFPPSPPKGPYRLFFQPPIVNPPVRWVCSQTPLSEEDVLLLVRRNVPNPRNGVWYVLKLDLTNHQVCTLPTYVSYVATFMVILVDACLGKPYSSDRLPQNTTGSRYSPSSERATPPLTNIPSWSEDFFAFA